MVLVGGALDAGVGAEGALVRLLAGMSHLVSTQRIVVASSILANVTAGDAKTLDNAWP